MFYAVKKGRKPGIYETWEECEKQISGFAGALFKKFKSEEEATQFMNMKIEEKKKEEPKYYYAVQIGSSPGVYTSWKEAEKRVKNFPHAVFKKFKDKKEAEDFVEERRVSCSERIPIGETSILDEFRYNGEIEEI